jgi:hypothetical protein
MSEDNKVVEMEERKELVEGGSEPREDFAPAPDDEEENSEGLSVEIEDKFLIIRDGDKFVKGKKKPNYGLKKKMKNLMRPNKMTVRGENEPVDMYLSDYELNKDLDLYILHKMLTDWSKDDKVTWGNILEDEDLGELLDKFAEEFKKINSLTKSKDDDSKN